MIIVPLNCNVVPETLGDDPARRVMSVDLANADKFGPRLDTVLNPLLPTIGISRPRSPAEIQSRSIRKPWLLAGRQHVVVPAKGRRAMSPRWATVAGYGLYFYHAERHRRPHVDVRRGGEHATLDVLTGSPSPVSCRQPCSEPCKSCSRGTVKRQFEPSTRPSNTGSLAARLEGRR